MNKTLVFQSDFGWTDGAVSAMEGVSLKVDENLRLHHLSHEIEPYNIWEASYRLFQTVEYWPEETVFVSVVDPGVGSKRKSVVAKTEKGQYIITPDNGTLTHLKNFVGIVEVREIEETKHRRENTEHSYTFHGRDVYANTGAKLASGQITFEDVGSTFSVDEVVELKMGKVEASEKLVSGCIDILDVRFGSLWTNIPREEFVNIGAKHEDMIEVCIKNGETMIYNNRMLYGKSFADVRVGEQIIYVNSLYRMAVAINQGNFAKAYSVGTGIHWTIEFRVAN
ncbi:MAG: SAM hydrolase/SAM-dependent halogenase family protein [Anaerovoracaceae bacterium]